MKSDKELFDYILDQVNILISFYEGKDEETFLGDEILKNACLMKLIVIGEYSSKISDDQKSRFSEMEWGLLKAARNYYAHAYGSISWVRVWETLEEDIPGLKPKIENIISILEKESNGKTN